MNDTTVEVWADVRCPWCWMGHRRLSQAIAESAIPVKVRRRSFLLEPQGPVRARTTVGTIAVSEWGMTEQQWDERRALIEQTGRTDGLTIRIDTARSIDSRPAHRVLKLAAARGLDQDSAWETMYAAHLEHNRELEDWGVLADIGETIGLGRDETLALADTDRHQSEVIADHRAAHTAGVSSVPTIAHADRMLSGARSVAEVAAFLRSVAQIEAGAEVPR